MVYRIKHCAWRCAGSTQHTSPHILDVCTLPQDKEPSQTSWFGCSYHVLVDVLYFTSCDFVRKTWKWWVLKLNTGNRSYQYLKNILLQCQLWITSHTHSLIWSCGHSPFRHSETINATHPSESFLLWAG